MTHAITFISHFRVKPGHAVAFRELARTATRALEADKPRTAAFLAYLAEDESTVTFVHVFPDVDSMAAHFAGAEERSAAAYEHLEPAGWEVYGAAHAASLAGLRAAAERAGVPLTVEPIALGGFLRTEPR